MIKKKARSISVITALILICLSITACGSQSGSKESRLDAIPTSSQILDNATISYLGPEGTYTEEAAKFFFKAGNFSPKETVDDAISDIIDHNADYAVIPQENTLGGAVTNYVDALIASDDVYVVGEVILPINQTLMGIPGASVSDIKTVCSHAQGLTQSEKWRKENLPDAAVKEMDSTAAAASYVSESNDKTIAAIAAPGAADLYGLSVLAENVQITDANKTRFYVLSLSSLSEESAQTNASFVVSCSADLIDDIIVKIHESGAQIVTIHDRPEGSALGTYNYIIEIKDDNGLSDKQISDIISFPNVRYLGRFNTIEKSEGH